MPVRLKCLALFRIQREEDWLAAQIAAAAVVVVAAVVVAAAAAVRNTAAAVAAAVAAAEAHVGEEEQTKAVAASQTLGEQMEEGAWQKWEASLKEFALR